MAYCGNCGKQIDDKAVVCVHCGCETGYALEQRQVAAQIQQPTVDNESGASAGQLVLSTLFPFVGIIMFCVLHSTKPKAATNCLVTGLIAWVIATIILLL